MSIEVSSKDNDHDENYLEGPKFRPLLFIQRYEYVAKVVTDQKVKSLIDFGCCDCRFISRLCKRNNTSNLETIYGIDKDSFCLSRHKKSVLPGPSNFIYEYRRETPLKVALFEGSVHEFDERFCGIDAVSMIEVIEHLPSNELENFPKVVFGKIRPKLVVITTPNREFNILFNNVSQFRHTDHKFEWTRSEFREWINKVCSMYGYYAIIDGVGYSTPEDLEKLGYCSQIVIFRRNDSKRIDLAALCDNVKVTCYEEICSAEYPVKAKISDKEKLALEVSYYIRLLAMDNEDGDEKIEIPLSKLIMFNKIQNLCSTVTDLRKFLLTEGYNLDEGKESIILNQNFSDNELDENQGFVEQKEEINGNRDSVIVSDECWDDEDESEKEWGAVEEDEKGFTDERFEDAETVVVNGLENLEINHSRPWKKRNSSKGLIPDVIKGGQSLHNLLKGNYKLEYNVPKAVENNTVVEGQFDDAD